MKFTELFNSIISERNFKAFIDNLLFYITYFFFSRTVDLESQIF